jgi:hypothetical protein
MRRTDGDSADGDATDGDATDGDAADGDAADGDATDSGGGRPMARVRLGWRLLVALAAVALAAAAATGCSSAGGAGAEGDLRGPDRDAGRDASPGGDDLGAPDGGPADGGADAGPDAVPDALPDALADAPGPSDAADGAADVPPDVDEGLEEAPLTVSEAFRARQAEYLALCFERGAPGRNSLDAQVCRVAAGAPGTELDEAVIDAACAFVDDRRDTADFRAATLVRLLYLDDANPVLAAETRARVEDTLRRFKYWLDQPGQDRMCYWSENHQILFHSAELLVGQRFRDETLPNAGMTGAEHVAHARPRIERWLDLRGRYGFSEWHSNVYFNEDLPALANLVDFAEDPTIRTKAAAVLDLLAFDLLNNTFDGYFATTHGRTYPSKLVGGLNDSTADAAWLLLGLGPALSRNGGNFSAAFFATSPRYAPPALLEDLARDTLGVHEHRQHDSFDIADGPVVGLTYTEPDDLVVWAGLSAIAAPETVDGTMAMLDTWNLWDGFLFGDLPPQVRGLLRGLAGTPGLRTLATEVGAVSYGIALQGVSTYTYRNLDYQLSGAQDYHPGTWGAQTHMWQATLDGAAYVFTNLPSELLLDIGDDVSIGGGWTGSWHPRVTLHRNVGVVQYRVAELSAVLADYLVPGTVHAYVPRSGFDEVREVGHWVLGRKAYGLLALWSQAPGAWAEGSDHALETGVTDNVYVVELGRTADWGSFDAFVAAVTGAAIGVTDGRLVYQSPSLGEVAVGWTGPLTVAGEPVDLGPYRRWDNASSTTAVGAARTRIRHGETILELDATAGVRRLLVPRTR